MNIKSKVLAFIIIFSMVTLLFAGCSDSSSSSTASSSQSKKIQSKNYYNVGETANIDGVGITVIKVEKTQGTDFDKPKDGMEYVIVTVQINNASKDKVSYNPLDFKLENSKGQVTAECISTVNSNSELQSGDIAPNGNVEGSLIFEEPVNDSALILQYQDDMFSNNVKLQFKLN